MKSFIRKCTEQFVLQPTAVGTKRFRYITDTIKRQRKD